jgi:hypothetical protein
MHTHFQEWPSDKEARLLRQHASPDVPQPEAEQPDASMDQTDAVAAQVAETTIQGREAERIDEEVVKNLCVQIQEEIDQIYADPNLTDAMKHDRVVQVVQNWNDTEIHHFGFHASAINGVVNYSKLDADSTYYQSPEVKQVAAEVQNAGRRLHNVMGVVAEENPGIIRGSPQYKYLYAMTKQRLRNEYNALKQRLDMVRNGYSYQDAMNATGGNPNTNVNGQNLNSTNTANTVVDDAAEQQNILRNAQGLLTKWQNAKTQKDRDFCEGMMMMQGIDVDASDLKNNEMKVAPREARSLTMLMGLFRAAKAFFTDKKDAIESDDETPDGKDEKKPEDKSADERKEETEKNEKRIGELKKKESDLTKEIEDIENKISGKKSATGEDPSEEETKELEAKKKELEETKEEIKKLEARNEELKKVPEKKEEEKEDDEFVQKFKREKKEASEELRKGIKELAKEFTPEKVAELMEAIGSVLKIDPKELKTAVESMKKNLPKMIDALGEFFDNLLDAVDLEKVSDGKYRLTFDASKMEPLTFEGKEVFTMDESDIKESFPGLFTERVGGKLATKPMGKLELGLALRSVR